MKQIKNVAFIAVMLCFIANASSLKAQNNKNPNGLPKYQVAIDMQKFFSDGIPNKVLFKINTIRDKQIKGALRLGVDASYFQKNIEGTDDAKNYEHWYKEESSHMSFLLGYEKHSKIKGLQIYYGLDIKSFWGNLNYPPDEAGDSNTTFFDLTPFLGINLPISKHFSTSFEAGIGNTYNVHKYNSSSFDPEHITKHTYFKSQIKFPYTLSINFNF